MQSQWKQFKQFLTPELITVLLVKTVTIFAVELLTPILPLFLADNGVNVQDIGLMFSVMIVAIAISEISWGWLVDRTDLKLALFMGTLVAGLATGIFLIARSTLVFYLAFFLFGFYRSPLFIAGRWYMGVHSPHEMKAFAMALIAFNWGVTQGITGIASGFITQSYGYRVTLLVSVGVLVVSGLILAIAGRKLDFSPPKREDTGKQDNPDHGLPGAKKQNAVGQILAVTLLVGTLAIAVFICYGIISSYLPLYAKDIVGVDTRQVGILFSLRGWTSAILVLPLARVADMGGRKKFLPITMAIIALSMIGIGLTSQYFMVMVCVFLFGLGMTTLVTVAAAIISDNVPTERIGLGMGIYGLMEDIGWMVGPAVGGFIWDALSPQATFHFGAVSCLVVLGLYFFLAQSKRFGLQFSS